MQSSPAPSTSRLLRILALGPQLLLLTLFWLAGEAIAHYGHLPLPGSIIGMFLLLAALSLRIVPASALEGISHLLLREMLLFFVPAVLVVLDHPEFLGLVGIKIVGIILLSTVMVMAATGTTIEVLSRRNRQHSISSQPQNNPDLKERLRADPS